MNDLTKVVLEELQTQTKAKYPNAVALVGVNIDFSQIGSGENDKFIAAQASGTALVRKAGGATGQTMAPQAAVPVAVGGRRRRHGKARGTRKRRN